MNIGNIISILHLYAYCCFNIVIECSIINKNVFLVNQLFIIINNNDGSSRLGSSRIKKEETIERESYHPTIK